ncbi:MAG: Ppx/GppA family phosphatase [Balneolaceae bacterium]|nr:Ppx/GppA family phosphatase [Balneolaceae bacterium]MCH8548097.1 Ppx/GppA family phosphatase [Balneolaceae bacterium]
MTQSSRNEPVRRITAIDLGTNSFHALIVDIYSDGSFYTVDKLKEMVLLSERGSDNRLSDAAMERGLDALKKIRTLSDHQRSEEILAYATSAIREAENGGEFIQKAIDEAGIKINAIPGRVEAELIGLAVQHGVKMPDRPALIMDIGGGSVEYILADKKKLLYLTSKKLGVARMTAAHANSDPLSKEDILTLQKHYHENLTDVAEAFAMHRASTLIGSSGTMQNIAAMIAARKDETPSFTLNEYEFSDSDFFKLYDDVMKMDRDERAKLKGLDEKRIDLLPAGLVLVNYIINTFSIRRVRISSQALREGIILRYIHRELEDLKDLHTAGNPRRRSVLELVHKCNWHEQHSRHVAKLSMKLFDELKESLSLDELDGELLEYAAWMHDIGYHISHRKHHKHALYIIRNSDLLGFKEHEIELMANVARYHRRSTPKQRHPHYNRLNKKHKSRIKKLSAILRVADGLDRSHYQNVRKLNVVQKNGKLRIEIRTEADPHLEIWGAMRKNALLEEVTGCKVEVARKGAPATY